MLKTSLILIFLQLSMNVLGNNKIGRSKGGGNETNSSNSSISKKSTRADCLTFKSAKKGGANSNSGGGNTKKGVKAARGFDYLTPGTKKAFNLLRHAFTHAPIFQLFDQEEHIQIEIKVSGYTISGVLN